MNKKKKIIIFALGIITWLAFAYLFRVSGPTLGLVTGLIVVVITALLIKDLSERRIRIYDIQEYDEFRRDRERELAERRRLSGEGDTIPGSRETESNLYGSPEQQRVLQKSRARVSEPAFIKPERFEQYVPLND